VLWQSFIDVLFHHGIALRCGTTHHHHVHVEPKILSKFHFIIYHQKLTETVNPKKAQLQFCGWADFIVWVRRILNWISKVIVRGDGCINKNFNSYLIFRFGHIESSTENLIFRFGHIESSTENTIDFVDTRFQNRKDT
jgi:hypothetical protein